MTKKTEITDEDSISGDPLGTRSTCSPAAKGPYAVNYSPDHYYWRGPPQAGGTTELIGSQPDVIFCSALHQATRTPRVSISASLRTGIATGSIPSDPAAALNAARKFFLPAGAVSGLTMNAARLMPGAISL